MATQPMKDNNPSAGLRRAYREMNKNQYVREAYQNSVEAGAGQVHLTVDASAKEGRGVKRAVMIDNGPGIQYGILEKVLNRVNSSTKDTGGEHQNFGIGLKVSALIPNSYGLIIICKTADKPKGFMIWLHVDERGVAGARQLTSEESYDSGDMLQHHHKVDFEDVGKLYSSYTIDGIDYMSWWERQELFSKAKYTTGTAIIFCGRHQNEDTSTSLLKEGRDYLASRYLKYPASVICLRADIESHIRLYLNDPIDSLKKFGKELKTICLNGWTVRTFLKRSDIDASKSAQDKTPLTLKKFVEAIVYKNELYGDFVNVDHRTLIKKRNEWGLYFKQVANLVTILVYPPEFSSIKDKGAYPGQTRANLLWKNGKDSSPTLNLPIQDIQEHYKNNMPEELIELLAEISAEERSKAKKSNAADLIKEWTKIPKERKNRGKRQSILIKDERGDQLGGQASLINISNGSGVDPDPNPNLNPNPNPKPPKTDEELEREKQRRKAREERKAKMDESPSAIFVSQSDSESEDRFLITLDNNNSSWEAAFYQPFNNDGSGNILYLNRDHSLFESYKDCIAAWWAKEHGHQVSRDQIMNDIIEPYFIEYAPCAIRHLKAYVIGENLSTMIQPDRLTQLLLGQHIQMRSVAYKFYKLARKFQYSESEAS